MDTANRSLLACLEDAPLESTLRRILGEEDPGLHAWPGHRKALKAFRFVLPVLGIQGAGKSSLLNALCFDHPVLPVEAAETTAVPVEIVHAERPAPLARVHFADGRCESVPAQADALKPFVDHARNPGNGLKVTRVVVESASPILSTGAVLVDLPGFGSLDLANQKTALDYLEEAAAVLFLLRDQPPLTQTEASRLVPVWMRSPIVFAMNRWNRRREEEIGEAAEAVARRLEAKATQAGIPLPGGRLDIHRINVWQALTGTLKQDDEAIGASGLPDLLKTLGTLTAGWGPWLTARILERVRQDLQRGQAAVASRLADLALDPEAACQTIEAERARFQEAMAAIRDKRRDLREAAAEWRRAQLGYLDTWEREEGARIRNKVSTLASQGLTDGPQLDQALSDEFQHALDGATQAMEARNEEMQAKAEETLTSIQGIRYEAAVAPGIGRPKTFKYERYAEVGLGAVAAVGCAAAGATFGLSLIISAGAMLAGVLVRKTGSCVRSEAAQAQVFPHIREVLARNRGNLESAIRSYERTLNDGLEAWERGQSEQAKWTFDDRERAVRQEQDQKARTAEKLAEDGACIEKALSMLGGTR